MQTGSVSTTPKATLTHVLEFRRQFPIFESKVHLANNAKGALSHTVVEAHQQYLDSWRKEGAPWDLWLERHEQLRASFAELIGAHPHEIAVCASATLALAAIASCLDWQERPAVAFDDHSFPSVTYLWHAQALRGANVRRVPPDDNDEIPVEAFDSVIDGHLRLLSVAHVSYKNGHRIDLPALAARARAAGAWFVVDDYQCTGTRQLDVRDAGIDILTTGTLKYLLGSPGVALLYVREELLEHLHPTLTGWFGQRDPMDFQVERHLEAPDAARFQSGTPAIPAVYDSLAGIELVKSVGLARIESWVDSLTALVIEKLDQHGFAPATPREPAKRGPHVAIRSHDMERAVAELGRREILVTSRDGNVRTAWHYYNTPDDVAALIEALEDLGHLMVRQ